MRLKKRGRHASSLTSVRPLFVVGVLATNPRPAGAAARDFVPRRCRRLRTKTVPGTLSVRVAGAGFEWHSFRGEPLPSPHPCAILGRPWPGRNTLRSRRPADNNAALPARRNRPLKFGVRCRQRRKTRWLNHAGRQTGWGNRPPGLPVVTFDDSQRNCETGC